MTKYYPLHPGQIHAEPYYCTVPLEEYESMKKHIQKLEKDNATLEKENKAYEDDATSGDYNHLVAVSRKMVDRINKAISGGSEDDDEG